MNVADLAAEDAGPASTRSRRANSAFAAVSYRRSARSRTGAASRGSSRRSPHAASAFAAPADGGLVGFEIGAFGLVRGRDAEGGEVVERGGGVAVQEARAALGVRLGGDELGREGSDARGDHVSGGGEGEGLAEGERGVVRGARVGDPVARRATGVLVERRAEVARAREERVARRRGVRGTLPGELALGGVLGLDRVLRHVRVRASRPATATGPAARRRAARTAAATAGATHVRGNVPRFGHRDDASKTPPDARRGGPRQPLLGVCWGTGSPPSFRMPDRRTSGAARESMSFSRINKKNRLLSILIRNVRH